MYVCKVIGKIISTVKNEKLVGQSIVLVQAAALNDRGSLEADGTGFAAADFGVWPPASTWAKTSAG